MRLSPKPRATSSRGDRRRRASVMRQDEQPRAGRDVQRERSTGRPCRVEQRHAVERPGEARGGEREGGDAAAAIVISSGGTRRGERRADAELHRIAGGEHADAAAAHGGMRSTSAASGDGQAMRSLPSSVRRDHGEMALAADQHLGGVDQRRARPAKGRQGRPRRCRRRRATGSSLVAEDQRVQRRRRHGAAAAPAVQRDEGEAEIVLPRAPPSIPPRRRSRPGSRAPAPAFGAPPATSSSSRKSAVGALPMTTIAPVEVRRQQLHAGGGARLAGAGGEVLRARAGRSRHGWRCRAASRVGHQAGGDHAHVAEDRRAARRARPRRRRPRHREKARSATTSGMPQACTMRAATGGDVGAAATTGRPPPRRSRRSGG